MKYSVIVIGDELLIGQVIDTNSGWIARHMSPLGWDAQSVKVISDDASEIRKAIDEAFAQTDVVLMTGGLGPTKDDITKPTLCEYFGGELVLDESVSKNVEEVMSKRHYSMNNLTAMQAMVPSTCRVIQNKVGTAPIMWFEKDGKVLVSMPGVPHETETMMELEVIPQLMKHFSSNDVIKYRTFVVIDYPESELAMKLEQFEAELPNNVHLAYLPKPAIIRLRLTGVSHDEVELSSTIDALTDKLHSILGNSIISDEDKELPEIVGDVLRKKGLALSTAESCTGGNIAHVITEIAGSSDYFVGSVVSYCNEVKNKVLKVPNDVLDSVGAVSQPVVEQMVKGVSSLLGTDCAVSTSGIAGPGGAVPGKPVGTVWMAAKFGDKVESKVMQLPGNRVRVINRATTEVLLMLLRMIQKG